VLSDFGKNDILKVAFFGTSNFPFLWYFQYFPNMLTGVSGTYVLGFTYAAGV
jgi:hypothetical protein